MRKVKFHYQNRFAIAYGNRYAIWKIRSEVIRQKLQVENVLDFIEKSQLRWYGHVKRMDTSRYPRKYLDWKPAGKRSRGRPRNRWIQNIGDGIRRRGKTFEEIDETELYDDKKKWRKFLHQDVPVQLTGTTPNRRRT